MTSIIKNKLNNFEVGSDYSFSVDDDKQIYTIYSGELKQFLREIIVNKVLSERFRRSVKMEGHTIDGGYFYYEGGIGDLPDRFIANTGWEEKFRRRMEEVEKQEEEAKRRDREIGERIEKEGIPLEKHSFHFSRWEGDSLVEKKSLFLNYNPFESQIENNPSKIQEITDKETKQEKTNENPPNSDKQGQQTEKENNQRNLSQKIDNKDNNSKSIYCGIGVISLVVLVIMLMVRVKKRK